MKNRFKKYIHLKDLYYENRYSLYRSDNYKFSNYGLSNSLINVYLNCPMKFFLKINCVELVGYNNTTTLFGTEVHKYLDEFYKKKKINYKKMLKNLALAKHDESFIGRLYGVLKAYEHIYKKDDFENFNTVATEYTIEKQVLDIPIKCKIDLKTETKYGCVSIMDHKTSAYFNPERIDATINLLAIDQQTNLYLSMEEKHIQELIYNLIYHPSKKRIRQNENILSFSKRIFEDITHKPEENFLRISLSIDSSDKKRFMNNFKRKLKSIIKFFNVISKHGYKAIPLYTGSCLGNYNKPCKYLPVCAKRKIDLNRYRIGSTVMKEYEK